MVPLTTQQGLTPGELAARIGTRPILVWGVGDLAQDVVVSLTKSKLIPQALIHDHPEDVVPWSGHPPLQAAAAILEKVRHGWRPFIVLATSSWRRQAQNACRAAGLVSGVDFLDHLSISRPRAVIEISAKGWLHRPLNDELIPEGEEIMHKSDFSRLIGRFATDLPLLSHIEFGWWNDPLNHPQLPELIGEAERLAPTTVVTRLAGASPLSALVEAAPSRIDVLMHGYGTSYCSNQSGHAWQAFLSRLDELATSLNQTSSRRIRTRLVYYPRRGDPPNAIASMRTFLAGKPIALAVENPYPMPYDLLLARCETGIFPVSALSMLAGLPWDVEAGLRLAASDASHPCLSQRVFPVIRHDRALALCHLYRTPTVAPDYLAKDWSSLLEERHRHPHCRRCQKHGLHRLDLDVLRRRHPQVAPLLEANHEQT